MDLRQQKGIEIAKKGKIEKRGNFWFVPSQSKGIKYRVDLTSQNCTCPDNGIRRAECKHLFAAEHKLDQMFLDALEDAPQHTAPVKCPTYRQNWRAYNTAQRNEKALSQKLLFELCNPIANINNTTADRVYRLRI